MSENNFEIIGELAKKFTADELQRASHAIAGTLDNLSGDEQGALTRVLKDSEGKSLHDLNEVIRGYFIEKTRNIEAARQKIGEGLKRRSTDIKG